MTEIKRIDIGEFREAGFLQEANRLFFHPHGLALEITSVDAEGWTADNPRVKAMADAIDRAVDSEDLSDYDVSELKPVASTAYAVAAMNALYPPGSRHISGVWDSRDDPEGVVFGSWYGRDLERVEKVAAERERHREARAKMFGIDLDVEDCDVERTDFVYPEPADA